MLKQLGTFAITAVCLFALMCASVCPPIAASVWISGKVVYVTNNIGGRDIAVMGPNGEHVDNLTFSSDNEYNPTWSPDGTEILYVRYVSGRSEVWLMDDDGDNQRSIVSFGKDPSWAPDGDRFVARDHWDETLNIYTLNAARDGAADIETIVSSGNPAYPAWSPDGKYIAYVAGAPDRPAVGGSLYVYDVAAERSTKIVSGSPGRNMSQPTWGPQSWSILFAWEHAAYTDGKRGIFSVSRLGGGLGWEHAWGGYYLYHPTVAPYGGEIIFARHDPNTNYRDLWKVTSRTRNWQLLDPDIGFFHDDPDWWHPSRYSVEPGASQLTTTWGSLKKKAK